MDSAGSITPIESIDYRDYLFWSCPLFRGVGPVSRGVGPVSRVGGM